MKDKEKQIFDKYGNYDFPTEIKQDGLNTATTQIEEMANILCESKEHSCNGEDCKCLKQATDIFNKGARIIPQDSVVISREEYSNYLILQKNHEFIREKAKELQADNERLYKNIGKFKEIVRKETAEKILDLLVPDCKACDENWHSGCLCLRATLAEKIAKQFGVEIKE